MLSPRKPLGAKRLLFHFFLCPGPSIACHEMVHEVQSGTIRERKMEKIKRLTGFWSHAKHSFSRENGDQRSVFPSFFSFSSLLAQVKKKTEKKKGERSFHWPLTQQSFINTTVDGPGNHFVRTFTTCGPKASRTCPSINFWNKESCDSQKLDGQVFLFLYFLLNWLGRTKEIKKSAGQI